MDHLGLHKYSPTSFNKLRCCSSTLTEKDIWSKNARKILNPVRYAYFSLPLPVSRLRKRKRKKTVCERNKNILICKKLLWTLIKLWFVFINFLGF